jgi:general secretion pathway protein B
VVYQQMPEGDIEPAVREALAADNAANAADASTAGMPTADQLVARGTVPVLHMDLHVYGNRPQDRFIFVNSKRYKEGDTLAEGPVVEQITPTGAVLSQAGNRFLLTRD